jgi:hypothetical protein
MLGVVADTDLTNIPVGFLDVGYMLLMSEGFSESFRFEDSNNYVLLVG